MDVSLLISPLARGAFFTEYLAAAHAELNGLLGTAGFHRRVGDLDFLECEVSDEQLPEVLRLSCVQGVFERVATQLRPIDLTASFALHPDFVFGSKYRGKTNETFTQFLLNVGLQHLVGEGDKAPKLLDPMCGRGTTLLWALRYGLSAKGIEQEEKALGDLRQNVKKWCKIHRQKHRLSEGFVGRSNKQNIGKFIRFAVDETAAQLIRGDTSTADELLNGETFDLIIADLPYGVQHVTTKGTRNPLVVLRTAIPAWARCLKKGGAMVLAYNRNLPSREELMACFAETELVIEPFSIPHRMSESIIRDVLVCTRRS